MKTVDLISNLLKHRESSVKQLLQSEVEFKSLLHMFLLSLCLYSLYGFIIGYSQNVLQAISSALKLPVLFYLCTLICFPTLYFFLSFLGVKQNFKQILAFMVFCNTFISFVLTAFAPVSFFFLITSYQYTLFKLINLIIFSVAGLTGIYLFYREIYGIILELKAHFGYQKQKKGILFLRLWAIMYAIIGLQLSFTLSPFFGLPNTPFILFTNEKSNFFIDILNTIYHVF
ncbi:MAG: hypothetical protein R2852_06760 [Bacteroidia bacterium]